MTLEDRFGQSPTHLPAQGVGQCIPANSCYFTSFSFCADFTDTEKDTGVVLQSSLEESGAPSNFDSVAHYDLNPS